MGHESIMASGVLSEVPEGLKDAQVRTIRCRNDDERPEATSFERLVA